MGSSQTRDRTRLPCIGRQILNHCTTREVPDIISFGKSLEYKGRRKVRYKLGRLTEFREDLLSEQNPVKRGKRIIYLDTGLSVREEKVDVEIGAQNR